MTASDDRLAALEARLRALEDELTIIRLMATYGPSVDSLASEVTSALWTDDGFYDAGVAVFEGAESIRTMVETEPHRGFVAGGAAHVVSAPRVMLDGDTAVAICHSQLLFRDEAHDGWRVWRVTANRWEWARTPDGWRVTGRTNRPLDGSTDATDLFRSSLPRAGT
jgi:hypothetical protein